MIRWLLDKINGFDTLRQRATNPFKPLSHGEFSPESLYYYPGNGIRYLMAVDTTLRSRYCY
jgi:hypothetical protein